MEESDGATQFWLSSLHGTPYPLHLGEDTHPSTPLLDSNTFLSSFVARQAFSLIAFDMGMTVEIITRLK